MPETIRRSGCATILGIGLIVLGSLFLFANLFGWSLSRVSAQILYHASTYWPALLIIWGAAKLFQRINNPQGSRVSAAEVFVLLLLVFGGITLTLTRRTIDGISGHMEWEELLAMVSPESRGSLHRFTEETRLESNLDETLTVENRRGAIHVVGWDEPDIHVVLTKRIYHRSVERAEELAATVRLSMSAAPAQTLTVDGIRAIDADRLETDLTLKIPKSLAIHVRNGRGPVRAENLANTLTLATTYDPVDVEAITGNVRIDSRRAPVRVRRISGNLEVSNQHGTITATNIDGELVAETSNASIRIRDVSGTARLKNRHARIRASHVEGHLNIEATHTEVHAEELGAGANIQTTYRPVTLSNIAEGVSIEAKNAAIDVGGVSGDVIVNTVYRPVTISRVQGSTTVRARQSRVRLSEVGGPVDVESSDRSIEITDPGTSVRVAGNHAPVFVDVSELSGEVNIVTSYGDITLSIPKNSSFSFRGSMTDGDLRSDFDTQDWNEGEQDGATTWSGSHLLGDSIIQATTSYGDLVLQAKE